MALEPRPADYPRIRKALSFYRITSIITGVMLLLLLAEMILKYVLHYEIFVGGPNGFLTLEQVIVEPGGGLKTSMTSGFNLSTGILIAHGWFYVVYLFGDFRLWSLMRWPFMRFLVIALGGVVPFLSFFMEVRVVREVEAYLAEKEQGAKSQSSESQDAELEDAESNTSVSSDSTSSDSTSSDSTSSDSARSDSATPNTATPTEVSH